MRTGRQNTPHRIGVIGESGVGKSTLLNALVSERLPLLPQGGVGPLTAVPIEVCYAETPYLKVGCRDTWRVLELLDACARSLSEPSSQGAHADVVRVRHAMLLACGRQFGQKPLSEVCTFLRQCCSREPLDGYPSHLVERVLQVRRLVKAGDAGAFIEIEAGLDLPGLISALADYGGGPLSPVTASIELGWDAPLLDDGLTLVDLPGLGVANDLHPLATQAAAGAIHTVLLVVDRSGVTEASAQLLQTIYAGFRKGSWLDGRVGPNLVVAVTKLDQVVEEMASGPAGAGRWGAALTAVASRAGEVIRAQLRSEAAGQNSPTALLFRRAVERVEVVPVFPLEYQRLHRRDLDDPPRLDRCSTTGIPTLMDHLRAAARPPPSSLTRVNASAVLPSDHLVDMI